MHRLLFASATALLFLVPTPAAAQEAGKVGVTMGFPESVGVVWHVTENLALRPEVSFRWSSAEVLGSEGDTTVLTTGLSALFYIGRWDSLATYVSPRYSFSRTSSTQTGLFGGEQTTTSRTHLFSGSFGAQYWLGDRFSAFGELGFGYTRGLAGPSDEDDRSRIDAFGTRSAVGVVFYF